MIKCKICNDEMYQKEILYSELKRTAEHDVNCLPSDRICSRILWHCMNCGDEFYEALDREYLNFICQDQREGERVHYAIFWKEANKADRIRDDMLKNG